MLSRIADSLFWLNRYMERADGLLRLTSTHYILSLDKDADDPMSRKPVLETFAIISPAEIEALENNTDGSLQKLLLDATNHNSLKVIVNRARENARGVQDYITKEVWEAVNQMYHMVNAPDLPAQLGSNEVLDVMDRFVRHSLLYTGIASTTMPRGTGWQFMNLGKYIERCLQTIVFIQKHLEGLLQSDSESNDILQWRYLLLSLSGYELHLKTYQSSDHNFNVQHQVVLNDNFSRSVLYSLNQIDTLIKKVTNAQDADGANLLRGFGRMHSKVMYMDLEWLQEEKLERFLEEIKGELLDFSRLLAKHFFSYH